MRTADALAEAAVPAGLAAGIREQALRTPSAIALADGSRQLTYAELDDAATRVAEGLRRRGVRAGDAVAVSLPRSWRLVGIMLGVLYLGAKVVPLDVLSPAERRRHIAADSASGVLVHDGAAPAELRDVVPLAVGELLAAVPASVGGPRGPVAAAGPETVSFLFYTSGTTGRPKGVEVRDAGILRLARTGWLEPAPGMRYACLANPAFDALSFEVWVPLLTGGTCVILGDEDVQTPEKLAATLLRERIGTMFITTALFNAVVHAVPDCFREVDRLLIGGEQLNARLISRWYRDNPLSRTRLYNVYGPTETTTFALAHPIPSDFDGPVVPIGTPLPGTTALLAAPGSRRAAAPGEEAELLLGGDGLAAGYRNLPEETGRRFVRLAWHDGGREVYYRTGDLVRRDGEGRVVYVGRADRQVKVRGFRIEPGEIEQQIATYPAVRQVYVCARRGAEHGPNELLAYLVTDGEPDFDDFDRHLGATLPVYMRPHQIFLVDALPLTANGKVDQAALLARTERPWRRPESAVTVADAWQREVLDLVAQVLDLAEPRLEDRWTAVGGDSLKALRLRFEIRRRWGCDLAQALVLRGDFAQLAAAVAEARAAGGSVYPVPAGPSGRLSAPVTSEQQRLWLSQQRDPRSRAYDVRQPFRLDGAVDAAALRRALCALVERHVALRTGFEAGHEGLVQVVGEPYDPWVEPASSTVSTAGAAQEAGEEFFAAAFDLARPRMLRACLLPHDGGATLLLHLHHIAVDGWSLNVLLRDLSAAYERSVRGAATLFPDSESAPVPTPLDFALWQAEWFASPAYLAQRGQLLELYAGREAGDAAFAGSVAVPPRPRAGLLHTALDAAARARVDRLCGELGVTRFQLLLPVFAWSVYGVCGRTSLRVAAPVANRPVHEFASSVGMFANTVRLPVRLDPPRDLRAEALRLAAEAGAVLERQDVALADVLAADTGGRAPFDFLFVLENTDYSSLSLSDCAATPLWWAPAEAKCAMTFSVVDHGDVLDCLWEYASDCFTEAEVAAMAELFRTGVERLAAPEPMTAAELASDYRRTLPDHGRGAAVEPEFASMAEGFARQVAATPDAPALVDGLRTVTYAELDAYAAALAAELRSNHPLPVDDAQPCSVALYFEPSGEHVAALLALARLNITIVPLDPSYPTALLRQVLEQAEPLCVLLAPGTEARFDALEPGGLPRHPVRLSSMPGEPEFVPHRGARPLYTLFTSGSTGVPKGVQVPDSTLSNLLAWQRHSGLERPAVTQQFSKLSFDVSFQEIFTTLCGGGRLNLVRPEWRQDVPALLEHLESAGAERIFMPYVALQLLAEHGVLAGRFPSRLREVVTAGEQLVCTDAVRRWFAGMPGARLFNHYGPTETHVVSGLCLDGDPALWPERPAIGRPVAGAVLRVVDEAGQPVPPGCPGELLLGGTMVGRCYLGDTPLNEERFTELPGEGLFYRSGDRARFDRDGLLHFLGRDDQQIKLSGHRLELGQVEAALLRHPAVVSAVVVVADGGRLVGCLRLREGAEPTPAELAAHLARLLPGYVRVDRFRRLESMPRTPSGKIDRGAVLRAPGTELNRGAGVGSALSDTEARLADAFTAATGGSIEPGQTFFEAGASSLGLMRFQLRCAADLGASFTIADLFEHVTLGDLAAFVDGGAASARSANAHSAASARIRETGGPIAVVGMAVRLPGAADLAAFWDLVRSGARGIEHFDAPEGLVGARSQMDGLLDFDPAHFGISPQEARLMDPQQRHMLMACVQALAHAGIADPARSRIGVIAAAGENTYFQDLLREADPDRLPDGFQLALHHEKDFLATKAAFHLGLTGPAFTVQAACASSLVAVHVAAGLLREGDADVILAGGVLVDTRLTGGYRYRPQHIFSPDGHCRPFSDDADGTVGGSGVGVVVLKTLAAARRDGDTVYSVITGSAVNNDGSGKLGYSAPSTTGQREVIRAALRRSGRSGAEIGYVEAHGTGTRLGDPVEVAALRQAFGDAPSGGCALASVKSQVGHLGAAAGVVGLIRATLALHQGLIPPNIDFRALNPQLGPDPAPFYIPVEALPWPDGRDRVAAVSSFGIGGANAHVVLETGGQEKPEPEVPPCMLLSGSSEAAVRADAVRIADYLEAHPDRYARVLRHLQAGRRSHRWRMSAVCPQAADAVAWLRTATPVLVEPAADESALAEASAAELVNARLAGRPVHRPTGSAQAPWDFPPPAFALKTYDFERAVHTPEWPRRMGESDWVRQPQWVRLRRAGTEVRTRSHRVLVLMTDDEAAPETVHAFEAAYARVVRVTPASVFARHGDDVFDVDPVDPTSLRRVLDALAEDGRADVDWLYALPLGVGGHVGSVSLEHARRACLDGPAALLRAAADGNRPRPPRIWWLSYQARPVEGTVARPELGLLAGPGVVAAQELPVEVCWLDLPGADLASSATALAALLTDGRDDSGPSSQIALRRGFWWEQVTVPLSASGDVPDDAAAGDADTASGSIPAGRQSVHLILGGTGAIGRSIAAWLLTHTSGRVLLLSRDPQIPAELESWSDRIGLVPADLAESAVDDVESRIASCTARLDTVVHAVGEGAGGLIVRRDPEAMHRASAAKLRGAVLTERLIARYRPAAAFYCSSMSSLFGGLGQYDYAAGNGLLDGFAWHSAGDDETTARIGLNWDVWREAGMAVRTLTTEPRHQAHLAVGLTADEGGRLFGRAVGLQLPQLLVSTTEIGQSRAFYPSRRGVGLPDVFLGASPDVSPDVSPGVVELDVAQRDAAGRPVPSGDVLAAAPELLDAVLRDLLGVQRLDPDAPLYDLGADSLTMLDLIDEVKRRLRVELDLAAFSHRVSVTEILDRVRQAVAGDATGEQDVALEVWQQGTGDDVLCLVHPVGGGIQAYRALVAALGPRLTVCLIADPALRDPGLRDPGLRSWSMPERARRYRAAVRARSSGGTGRLLLAGWSFGAWVALAMAAEAEGAGIAVSGLYLIDPPPPGAGAQFERYDEPQFAAVFAHELAARGETPEVGDQVGGQVGGQTGGQAGGAAQAYAERLAHCCRANLRSMAEFRMPSLSTTPSVVWLAARAVDGLPEPDGFAQRRTSWDGHLPTSSEWHELDTTHYGIVDQPHVREIAALIEASAGSRQARAEPDPDLDLDRPPTLRPLAEERR